MDPVEVLQKAYQDELLDALRAEGAAQGVPYPHVRWRWRGGNGPTPRPWRRP